MTKLEIENQLNGVNTRIDQLEGDLEFNWNFEEPDDKNIYDTKMIQLEVAQEFKDYLEEELKKIEEL